MRKIFTILLLLTMATTTWAATFSFPKDSTKKKCQVWNENHYLDMSLSGGQGLFNSSLQWDKLFAIAWKKRIKIGFGVRVNMTNSWDTDYHTVFYNRPAGGDFDTVTVAHQTTFSANLMFVADISLLKWLDAGLNIDLVGVSWGEKTSGTYHANGNSITVDESIRPSAFNAFLFGRNDRGTTNSQFYLRLWPSNDFFIKGGFSLMHVSQLSNVSFSNYGEQYISAHNMGFVSFGWTPGRNAWIKKKTTTTPVNF